MSTPASNSTIDPKTENPKKLHLAGSLLFALGLMALGIAFFENDPVEKTKMVLSVAVLLALGYPAMLYAKALEKIAILEKRIAELETKISK